MTFLFTDIEGSTRMWEQQAADMEVALALHDEVLNGAIGEAGGYVFSTAGDAFAAAFPGAEAAVRAAREVQLRLAAVEWPGALEVKVRIGLHTGTAYERDGDYFGPILNRAARIMSAGHGGQILLSSTTAEIVGSDDLVFLGEHRLKDLSQPERIFQVRRAGTDFAPLRTLDTSQGNLPTLGTTFVGRHQDLIALSGLIRQHRVVTLIGVGGVGKTRLALQVAAEVIHEFPDGAWFAELASVGDPVAVPDEVAATLGVMTQPGSSVVESIAEAVSGRKLLIVLDNCEHVLDAVADVVDVVTARCAGVTFLATSREAMRISDEHVWPVASLDVSNGIESPAIQLFADRARAVNPAFRLVDVVDAVGEICTRLDGIALAIELAAARMVSMTASEVRDRLDDRFRLLAGSRRGIERHQTLRHAVRWSYDLLDEAEQSLLERCSVFADGFDLAAAARVGEIFDDLDTLDLLDSLVRKSLVTAEHHRGSSRYGMLETIRQFAEERLAEVDATADVRHAHAGYYAEESARRWGSWNGPGYSDAVGWLEVELSNLRIAFRWALDESDLATAAVIASHAAMLGVSLQLFEPVRWAEEVIAAGPGDEIAQLPRLYTAASLCLFSGRADDALDYVRRAAELVDQPSYDPFPDGMHRFREANVHHFAGRLDDALKIFTDLAAQSGAARVSGACGCASVLVSLDRSDDALLVAEAALEAADELGNPFWIATGLLFVGRACERQDPARAMDLITKALVVARNERVPFVMAMATISAAQIEARHGHSLRALELYSEAVDLMHRSGELTNVANVALTFASLAHTFERHERFKAAATMLGVVRDLSSRALEVPPDLVERLAAALGDDCERSMAAGASMSLSDAVQFVRSELDAARLELEPVS